MKQVPIGKAFYMKNRQNVASRLDPGSLAILTSSDQLVRNGDQYFPFRQNSDLYYLTGINQEKTILALCPHHPDENLREILFTNRPDPARETWTGHILTKTEVSAISGIETVKWLDEIDLTLRDLAMHSTTIYANLNEYIKYLPDVVYSDRKLVDQLKHQFPLHRYERLAPLIAALRLIKQPEEIALIRKACEITGTAFERVLRFVKPGVSEYQVEAEITHTFISSGAQGHAYQPIVGSGKNGLVLHYIENKDPCSENDLLLLDFGAEYGNYAADCSRTIPVSGRFTPRQRACYEAVLRVQKKAIDLFVPGNNCNMVNEIVWAMMEQEMIALGLFTQEDVRKQDPASPLYKRYLMHGVSHFIGLDVHDVGSRFVTFENGMMLTIEPGLYIPEENIAIRIENNVVVGEPPIDLMAAIPREADEIEQRMADRRPD